MRTHNVLDIRKLLREGVLAEEGEGVYDLSRRDFSGFSVPGPVRLRWQAQPDVGRVRFVLWLDAEIAAECVRCLVPFRREVCMEDRFDLLPDELTGEYPEYPTVADGVLDLEELAYSELVMEVSPVTVCREGCEGLCAGCGQPKAACACAAATEQAQQDGRWDTLRALLDE